MLLGSYMRKGLEYKGIESLQRTLSKRKLINYCALVGNGKKKVYSKI